MASSNAKLTDRPLPGEEAPACRYCGKPCRWFEAIAGVCLGHYAVVCGGDECAARLDDDRAKADMRAEYGTDDPAEVERVITDRRLIRGEVPDLLRHHRLADFDEATQQKAPWRPADVFVYGPVGTGKSALAAAMLAKWPVEFAWIRAHKLLADIRSSIGRKRGSRSEFELIEHYAKLPILCIDDLGAESKSEFGIATLFEVMAERGERNRPTIATSNLMLSEIHEIEPRLASRLARYTLIKLEGKDRRLQR